MRQQNLRIVSMLVLGLLCWAPMGLTEPYIALYGGMALRNDTAFDTDVSLPGVPDLQPDLTVVSTIDTIREVRLQAEVDKAGVFGGKLGYWFDVFPFVGAELEVYTWSPDVTVPAQAAQGRGGVPIHFTRGFVFDVSVVTLGINFMGRYSLLKSASFPRGRFQPYIGVGPALFLTSIEDQEAQRALSLGSKTLTFGGLQALGGFKVFVLKKLAVFAEYKFSHFTADLSGTAENFSLRATQNIDANHFYGGLAYHFY